MRPVLAACLIIFAASVLACGFPRATPRATDSGTQKAGVDEILAEFRRDADSATAKYKGTRVVAAGEVEVAEQSSKTSKGPHVFLKYGPEKRDVVAAFFTGQDNAAALALKPGQHVRIKGTVLNGVRFETGVTLTLDDCELVK